MTLRHQNRPVDVGDDGSKPCNDFEHRQPFHIYQKDLNGNFEVLGLSFIFQGNQAERETEQYRTSVDPTEQDTGTF